MTGARRLIAGASLGPSGWHLAHARGTRERCQVSQAEPAHGRSTSDQSKEQHMYIGGGLVTLVLVIVILIIIL
jgi:hypothetical protein